MSEKRIRQIGIIGAVLMVGYLLSQVTFAQEFLPSPRDEITDHPKIPTPTPLISTYWRLAQNTESSRRGPLPPTLQEEQRYPATYYEDSSYSNYNQQEPLAPTPVPPSFEEMIQGRKMGYAKIKKIISGDLYELDNQYRIRLLGVKGPDPEAGLEDQVSFERQAAIYAQRMFLNRTVQLKFETVPDFSQEALPAYVYLPGGHLINEAILLEGWGSFIPEEIPSRKIADQMLEAQESAKRRSRGIWQSVDIDEPHAVWGPEIAEGTKEEPVPSVAISFPEVSAELPDTLILDTGERMMGKIEGDREASIIILRTQEGNAIAIPKSRIADIRSNP